MRALVTGALLASAAAAMPALAQSEDWPCVQRLVPRLEAGQMWSGPPVETPAQPSVEMQELARRLIDPKVPPETVSAEVHAFRDRLPEAERPAAMGQLFALSLDWLNDERSSMIGGIQRYARSQRALADRIVAETREVESLEQATPADATRLDGLRSTAAWDTRVFTDRQRSLRLVCDQPVLLEQRAFALARIIQDSLQ
ncbi:MAG: hypothetical protein ACJ8H8_11690 [Geminicoccaceae bacterium]